MERKDSLYVICPFCERGNRIEAPIDQRDFITLADKCNNCRNIFYTEYHYPIIRKTFSPED